MLYAVLRTILLFFLPFSFVIADNTPDTPVFFWKEGNFINFGDHLSLKMLERIVGIPLKYYNKRTPNQEKKLLAIGSVLSFANDNDTIWGTGVNGKCLDLKNYKFTNLDVRAIRGPYTKAFLLENLGIPCPEIYGDPALLTPYIFPEFEKPEYPTTDYIIVPHYADAKYFQNGPYDDGLHVVYATEPWDQVINKIIHSAFVISSSLHGIIVAEAYGIPARLLRISDAEPLFKFADYFLGSGRPAFQYASSIEQAFSLGGEAPAQCDVEKLYEAFPFDLWPDRNFQKPDFSRVYTQ